MSAFQHLSVNQLIQMQSESDELQIVDIRDAASYEAGHILGSVNLTNENLARFIGDADMDLPLIVVCYHGISSQSAATYLNEQGFDDVFSLDGGYSAWHQANL
ncbi:thiosulfate sulfurtransferase GlpE [Shewanella pealeana]|uniref:Rhodanese domain protein n=1 Tax=Shewanella pealeana (strain ATCC 700345 / ANG-SQ1) TaxID=398579 RepID=A8GYP7_SHEPA|nr:thiosulfate sulfurtransferase GlpE [Shewanella pealeana]ABV85434.1 Rhodanese domain protein [Shewanella pealeana ATCC 700345]